MQFHLGDVLSITTDKLLSPRLMKGVYEILNFMTSEDLFTHQLPRAADECRPLIIQQHPALAHIDASTVTQDNAFEFLQKQVEIFGEYIDIQPLPLDSKYKIDPIKEAEQLFGDKLLVIRSNKGE